MPVTKLASASVHGYRQGYVVAAVALAAWQYELRPTPTQQAVAATPQRAEPRQGMGVAASEDLLRAGEVLWPGQYKPH